MPSNPLCLEVEMLANNYTAVERKMGSSVLEHAIKVRKPYTINKQRERWTEEEHNKFLEALKLYGREWRQIEEHIGTKTAIQIRSHAQKFFSKVAREMTGDGSGQVKAIEIPPPRPKKKPSHPYPRKLGNSHRNPVMRKQEWSSIPNISLSEQNTLSTTKVSVHEQDNTSPTSVISVVGSDTPGSPASDLMNICTSPISCSDPALSAVTSVDDEGNSLCQPKSDMELESGADDSVRCKDASSMESSASSLKLFGQTVVLTEAQKQNTTGGTRAVQLDVGQTHRNSWPNGVTPMLYLFPSHGNLPNSTTANFSLEQDHLAFHREFSDSGSVESMVGRSVEASIGESDSNSVGAHSLSDSNSVGAHSLSYSNSVGAHSLSSNFRWSEMSAFRSLKAPSSQPAARKGFVPYIRCVAVRKVCNQITVNGNIEGRRFCL